MKYEAEKLGWKRRNPWANKGIYPPWVRDNEYRTDFIYNNPGYHRRCDIWWRNCDIFILLSIVTNNEQEKDTGGY